MSRPARQPAARRPRADRADRDVNQLLRALVASEAQIVNAAANMAQMEAAFYRLPVVPKPLVQGPRGGMYYVNARGRKVYLKVDQQRKLSSGNLPGCVGRECRRPRQPYRRMGQTD